MEKLVDAARAEWVTSGRDGALVQSLLGDLSEAYKAMQASARSDDLASAGSDDLPATLKAIGPNAYQLMSIASSELRRSKDAWDALQKAEADLNEAGHAGYVIFFGRPEGTTMSELPEIHFTYFRHRRLFLYSLDWENKICADAIHDAQKGHSDYIEVEVEVGSFARWMRETGRWPGLEQDS